MFVRFIRPAVTLLALMTILVGIVYPFVITGVAKVAFPRRAEGSLIYKENTLVGSALIGQSFSDPKYFWGRPSATTPQPYNGLASSGSNLGPLNPALLDQVKANAKALPDIYPRTPRASRPTGPTPGRLCCSPPCPPGAGAGGTAPPPPPPFFPPPEFL